MKIVNNMEDKGPKLYNCAFGTVVQFNKQFHQDYPPGEIYLVLNVIPSYSPRFDDTYTKPKIGVANLSTGKLSFVDPDRRVTRMDAKVQVEGPAS